MSDICPICHDEFEDPIYSCCEYLHPYCFKCVVASVKANNKLTGCVQCRDSNNIYLRIPNGRKIINETSKKQKIEESQKTNQEISDEEYFSLKYFTKSIQLIRKIINSQYSYSCLITENELKCFIKNKNNIILFNKIVENNLGTFENTFLSIKWEKINQPENLFSAIFEPMLEPRIGTGTGTGIGTGIGIGTRRTTEDLGDGIEVYSSFTTNPGQSMMDLFSAALNPNVNPNVTRRNR